MSEAIFKARTSYLPPHLRMFSPTVHEESKLSYWEWEAHGRHYLLMFKGKARKPWIHQTFRTDDSRQGVIEYNIDNLAASERAKKALRDEKKAWKHGVQVGQFFYASWGYDQTNVDFYQVVEVKGKTVQVRKVQKQVESCSRGSEMVAPQTDAFIGDVMKKRPQMGYKNQPSLAMGHHHAYLWDGRARHQTASGFGH